MKKYISLFLVLSLCLGLTAPAALAAESPAVSSNIEQQDQTSYSASTVKSYLFENGAGGLTRVEYTGGQIVVEDYSSNFTLQSTRTIPMELSIWGGFFAGANYNFFVFGQQNPNESNSAEVIRVVKYSKNWERLGQASLRGANTTTPFYFGSLRCAEYGGYLYIRTCHEMYTSDDGLNHQANMMLSLRQSDMEITDSFFGVVAGIGYVSHSFNQFVLIDGDGHLVALDHGDTYPRSAVLSKYNAEAGGGKFSGQVSTTNIQTFANQTVYQITGASLGGLTETKGGYVAAYNYDSTGGGSPTDRTVYLAYVPKSGRTATTHAISSAGATTPHLVSTGLDGGYILWNGKQDGTVTDTLYYASYDSMGSVGTVQTATGSLSDCAPIYHNGQVVWYVTDNSAPVFYTLNESGVTRHDGQTSQEATQPEEPDEPQRPGQEEWPVEGGDLTVIASGNSTVARDYVVLADGRLVNWKDGTLLDTGYQAVSFAENRYMGLKADGTLWAWGEWYSLSDNTIEEPVEVLSGVKQISGYLALKEDGSVWSPEPLKGMEQRQDGIFYQVIASGITQISSYREDAGTAVAEDGTLYSWGSNWYDAYLGRETDSNTGNPPASILSQVSYVNGHFAIREDGSLWSWGSNTFGTVGNGSSSTAVTPVKVMDRVVGAWADEDNLAAVRTADGTLWTWGVNNAGELGYADFDNRQTYGLGSVAGPGTPYQSTPKAVQIDNVIQVTAGGMDITLALKSDGTLWASGKGYGPAFIKVMDGVKTPGQEQQPTEQEKPNETIEAVFTDVPATHWAHDYVEKAAAEGWVNGIGNNRFAPDKEISYAEFSTMLVRAYYEDELNAYAGSSDPWFMPYCTVAHDLRLYDGTNMGQSAFDAIAEISCNRYEMAQLLYNILNDQDAIPEYDAASVQAKIGDWSSITGKYKDAVAGVFAAGLIGGVDANGTFNGDGVMTRAQAATVMCRLAELIGD